MTQITSQKKTKLIDDFDFDLFWTIKSQFYKNFWKMEALSPKAALKIRILETSIRHKNSENGPNFSSKIPEAVDVETIKQPTPVRKYYKFPPQAVEVLF